MPDIPQDTIKEPAEQPVSPPQTSSKPARHDRHFRAVFTGILLILLSSVSLYFFPYERLSPPEAVSPADSLDSLAGTVITAETENLYYTGCTDGSGGLYYYSFENGSVRYFLLTGRETSGSPAQLSNYTVTGLVSKNAPAVSVLDKAMTSALNWSSSGMAAVSSGILITEQTILPVYVYRILLGIAAGCGFFGAICILYRKRKK